MKRPKPSFGVQFDRSIARARVNGNDKLADHLEELRPHLNLASQDESEVFANLASAFARDLMAVCDELCADAFDAMLIISGIFCHMINAMHHLHGINRVAATHAVIENLQRVTAHLEKHDLEKPDAG